MVCPPRTLADGTISRRIRWFDTSGARRSEIVYGSDVRAAQRRLDQRLRETEDERVGLRRPDTEVAPTLSELGVRAVKDYLPSRQRPAQVGRTLTLLVQWWEPAIGEKPIDEITVADVRGVLSGMRAAGRAAATCNRALAALSVIFQFAEDLELVDRNPCRGRVRQREGRKVPRYLSPAEAVALITAADGVWRGYFATAIYAGLRRGELAELRHGDIDRTNRMIHVRRAVDRAGAIQDMTKSGHARSIDVADELWAHLPDAGPADHLVFRGRARRGRAPDPTTDCIATPQKALTRALSAARIERHISTHDLRHTFATLCVARGIDVRELQRLLGHSTLAMTAKYVHAVPVRRPLSRLRLTSGGESGESEP